MFQRTSTLIIYIYIYVCVHYVNQRLYILQNLEPVFTVQHFHLRLVFQLLSLSFFQNTVSILSKKRID